MKLVIFTPNANTGGTEKVSAIYAHYLSNDTCQIKVCSIFKPLTAYDSDKYPTLHSSLNLLRVPRLLRPLYLYCAFIFYALRGYRLLIQGEYPAAISYFLPFNVFIRVTNLPDRLHKSQPRLFFLFAQSLKKNICIFPSSYFKNLFPVPIGRYHILPNPFRPSYDSSAFYRIASSPGNNFIAVGQLNYQKDHEFMIRSFSAYVRNHSRDSRLFIYGTGEYGDALAHLIESLNMSSNIFLRGWSKQPWCEHRYDYHLLTSRWEGYPNVVVEAAHFRIPTLATPIPPGIHAIITENNIGLVSADTSEEAYVELLAKSPSLQCRFRDSFHCFDDFVALHSPDLLISALSSYV